MINITNKDFISEDNPILRQVAEPVKFPLSDEDRQLAIDMVQHLVNSQDEEISERYNLRPGVGLAAPQIGVSKQMFSIYVADYDEEGNVEDVLIKDIFINPKVISHSPQKQALKLGEGCLSVPRDVSGLVPRYKRIRFTYQDMDGNTHEAHYKGYHAIIAQHEIDHLNGMLYYDRINHDDPWGDRDKITLI